MKTFYINNKREMVPCELCFETETRYAVRVFKKKNPLRFVKGYIVVEDNGVVKSHRKI